MMEIIFNETLDAKGLACPMPIVKAKKAMQQLEAGKVMEIQATDKGSTADLKAWSKSAGHHYLGTVEDGDVLKHYLRKSNEEAVEKKHPHVVNNQQLQALLNEGQKITILDVREQAEYAFHHIPEALSIPLGELEGRMQELSVGETIYVICRTGSRSDLAAQNLTQAGFQNVTNVVPGMSEWP